jgi:hypothetical protein
MSKSIVSEKQKNSVKLCDGCDVREPFEHRCHGEGCDCDQLTCQIQQGRISPEEANKIAKKSLKNRK